ATSPARGGVACGGGRRAATGRNPATRRGAYRAGVTDPPARRAAPAVLGGCWMTPRQTMRTLIARRGYTMVPGAYDTLTARLVEQAGFDAVYLTGGGYSRANGYPDLGLL